MLRARALLLFPLIVLLAAGPLAAQHIDSPYRFIDTRQAVTLFAGRTNPQAGVVGLGPESGEYFGGRYTYHLSGPLSIEGEVGYFPLSRTVRDTTRTGDAFTPVGSADQTVVLTTAALRFDLTGPRTWYRLQPFLTVGGGAAIGLSGQNGADSRVPADARFQFGTSFAGMVGGGVEWYATRRVGLRLDGRGVLWKLKTPQAFALKDATLPANGDWTQNVLLSAGLSVHF